MQYPVETFEYSETTCPVCGAEMLGTGTVTQIDRYTFAALIWCDCGYDSRGIQSNAFYAETEAKRNHAKRCK